MKISFLSIFIFLSFFGNFSVAKNMPIEKQSSTTIESKFSTKKEDVIPVDLAKLFSEAEAYFKAAKAWKKIKCQPKSGFICTKHECKKRDIKSYLILDKEEKTISRCENENCESFAAQFNQTGAYINVQTEGPIGTLVRVLGNNRYKEISTVALDAYIVNGECSIVQDENSNEEENE